MPSAAPTRMQFNVAPALYEDPDISFNDLQEQLMVTNVDHREVTWVYAQRSYTFKPGDRPKPVKLEVIIKYLGDPRSAYGSRNVYRIPGESHPGVVPDRYSERRRLSVLYGIYEGMMSRMENVKFRDIPRDRTDPNRDLFPGMKSDWFVVPRMKVQNLDGNEIKFPVFFPDAHPYRYDSEAEQMGGDTAQEIQRLRALVAKYGDRIEALEDMDERGEADIPPAATDDVAPPFG